MPASAYSDPPTFTPLQTLTAAQQNALGDAIRAMYWWSAAGSIPYAYDADQLDELLAPARAGLLTHDGSVPDWLVVAAAGADAYKVPRVNAAGNSFELTSMTGLHKSGIVNFAPGQNITSWANITGASISLDLDVTCTIEVHAIVTGYVGAGYTWQPRAVVNGTADSSLNVAYGNGGEARNEGLPYIYVVENVPAGTRTIQLQAYGGGGTVHITAGRMIVKAFAE